MKTATTGVRRFKLWPRFRLRTLLALLSVVCLACGWEANRVHRRAHALALLERWNLNVNYGGPPFDRFPWNLLPDAAYCWEPLWRYMHSDVPHYLISGFPSLVPLPGSGLPSCDEEAARNGIEPPAAERKRIVAAIAVFRECQWVDVAMELDDDDMLTLSSMDSVEFFAFRTRRLTDAGIAHIKRLQKIETLGLSFSSAGADPVKTITALSTLPCLHWLYLYGPLSPDAFERVKAALPKVDVRRDPGGR
jgi:hypothetical protein